MAVVKPKLEYVDIFNFYIYVPGKQVVVSKKTALLMALLSLIALLTI